MRFSLGAVISLAFYLSGSRRWLLMVASVCFALAMMTRYVGLAFIPPILLACLFMQEAEPRIRLRSSMLVLSVPLAAAVTWFGHNYLFAPSLALGGSFGVHLLGWTHAKQLANALYDFWLPIDING